MSEPETVADLLASKSTAREIQVRKLLALLKLSSRDTYHLRRLGISHPAGRIADLKAEGHTITTTRVTVIDENSFSHINVALYSLVCRKEDAEVLSQAAPLAPGGV